MNNWWMFGATLTFLIIAVIVAIAFVITSGMDRNSPGSNATSTLAGVLLVISIVIIIAAFYMYFNGNFNQYKTTQDRLTLKYDYLTYYEPVQIMKGFTPATAASTLKRKWDDITPMFKSHFKKAIVALLQNKQRVETALENVKARQDVVVLSNYDFSVPCVVFCNFFKENREIMVGNQGLVTMTMIDMLPEIDANSQAFLFNLKGSNEKLNIFHVLGLYEVFVEKYPDYTRHCISKNSCPYVS